MVFWHDGMGIDERRIVEPGQVCTVLLLALLNAVGVLRGVLFHHAAVGKLRGIRRVFVQHCQDCNFRLHAKLQAALGTTVTVPAVHDAKHKHPRNRQIGQERATVSIEMGVGHGRNFLQAGNAPRAVGYATTGIFSTPPGTAGHGVEEIEGEAAGAPSKVIVLGSFGIVRRDGMNVPGSIKFGTALFETFQALVVVNGGVVVDFVVPPIGSKGKLSEVTSWGVFAEIRCEVGQTALGFLLWIVWIGRWIGGGWRTTATVGFGWSGCGLSGSIVFILFRSKSFQSVGTIYSRNSRTTSLLQI